MEAPLWDMASGELWHAKRTHAIESTGKSTAATPCLLFWKVSISLEEQGTLKSVGRMVHQKFPFSHSKDCTGCVTMSFWMLSKDLEETRVWKKFVEPSTGHMPIHYFGIEIHKFKITFEIQSYILGFQTWKKRKLASRLFARTLFARLSHVFFAEDLFC